MRRSGGRMPSESSRRPLARIFALGSAGLILSVVVLAVAGCDGGMATVDPPTLQIEDAPPTPPVHSIVGDLSSVWVDCGSSSRDVYCRIEEEPPEPKQPSDQPTNAVRGATPNEWNLDGKFKLDWKFKVGVKYELSPDSVKYGVSFERQSALGPDLKPMTFTLPLFPNADGSSTVIGPTLNPLTIPRLPGSTNNPGALAQTLFNTILSKARTSKAGPDFTMTKIADGSYAFALAGQGSLTMSRQSNGIYAGPLGSQYQQARIRNGQWRFAVSGQGGNISPSGQVGGYQRLPGEAMFSPYGQFMMAIGYGMLAGGNPVDFGGLVARSVFLGMAIKSATDYVVQCEVARYWDYAWYLEHCNRWDELNALDFLQDMMWVGWKPDAWTASLLVGPVMRYLRDCDEAWHDGDPWYWEHCSDKEECDAYYFVESMTAAGWKPDPETAVWLQELKHELYLDNSLRFVPSVSGSATVGPQRDFRTRLANQLFGQPYYYNGDWYAPGLFRNWVRLPSDQSNSFNFDFGAATGKQFNVQGKSAQQTYDYGATLGGPIVEKRFWRWEGYGRQPYHDYGADLRGYIVKDDLWFFGKQAIRSGGDFGSSNQGWIVPGVTTGQASGKVGGLNVLQDVWLRRDYIPHFWDSTGPSNSTDWDLTPRVNLNFNLRYDRDYSNSALGTNWSKSDYRIGGGYTGYSPKLSVGYEYGTSKNTVGSSSFGFPDYNFNYGGDDWKIRQSLTLNAGLTWSFYGPQATTNPLFGNSYGSNLANPALSAPPKKFDIVIRSGPYWMYEQRPFRPYIGGGVVIGGEFHGWHVDLPLLTQQGGFLTGQGNGFLETPAPPPFRSGYTTGYDPRSFNIYPYLFGRTEKNLGGPWRLEVGLRYKYSPWLGYGSTIGSAGAGTGGTSVVSGAGSGIGGGSNVIGSAAPNTFVLTTTASFKVPAGWKVLTWQQFQQQLGITAKESSTGGSPKTGAEILGPDDLLLHVDAEGRVILSRGPWELATLNAGPPFGLESGTASWMAAPLPGDLPQQISYSLVANGNSSGEAFELQVLDPSGQFKRVVLPDGVVVEPAAKKPPQAQAASQVASQAGNMLKQQITGFCLEFAKLPPEAGMLYKIADAAKQQQYRPAAYVLEAGYELGANGELNPDIDDVKGYIDAIRQYAAWAELEGWDEQQFTQHWIERTRKNAQAMNIAWSQQMEDALRAVAPNRWRDITKVRNKAKSMMQSESSPAR